MDVKNVVGKLGEIRKKEKAILIEFTLYDDGCGLIFIDYDNPDKENKEVQFEVNEVDKTIQELLMEDIKPRKEDK